ncbi:MAG: hypothetical protein Q9218_003064 [Villophora microphyllina]
MPSLTLPPASEAFIDKADDVGDISRSQSPTSPPFSPITPVMSSSLPRQGSPDYHNNFIPPAPTEVPLQPISESDNPDAIALRAAISILQMQRQQTLQDLKTLERQKQQAAVDPGGFARVVASGTIKTRSTGVLGSNPGHAQFDSGDSQTGPGNGPSSGAQNTKFEDIPGPQSIVRCPPVNWAKYHVMGAPLDKLHEEQRRRPVNYQSIDDGAQIRGEEDLIAAAYDPWKDTLQAMPQASKPTQSGSYGND